MGSGQKEIEYIIRDDIIYVYSYKKNHPLAANYYSQKKNEYVTYYLLLQEPYACKE